MKAAVGDRIVVVSSQVGGVVRDGKVVEVRGEDGAPPYLVEWSADGHRGLYFPGPDGFVHHREEPEVAPPPATHLRIWRVEVQLFEQGGNTSAQAALHALPQPVTAHGEAHLNPGDRNVPDIGDEIAAARALRALADALLATASTGIAAAEHHAVSIKV